MSTSKSIFTEKKNYLLLSLPIVAEWAWGYRAQRYLTDKPIGFYAQVGGALTLGRGTVGEFTNINPFLGGGFRIKVTKRIGLELSYGQNFISILEVDSAQVDYGYIPPFREDFGVAKINAKDRNMIEVLSSKLKNYRGQ